VPTLNARPTASVVAAATFAATMSETWTKSRVWLPSPWIVIGSPASA